MLKRGIVLLLLLATCSPALAQGLPSKKEIDEKIQKSLNDLPDSEATLEGVCTFVYKEVPSSPDSIIKLAAGNKLPAGVDPKMAMKMYMPVISGAFQRNLQEAGTFKVEKEIKIGSKKVPAGEHKFGYLFKGMQIIAVVIYPVDKKGKKKKPIKIALKSKVTQDKYCDSLRIKLEMVKKKKDKFNLSLEFFTQTSIAKPIKISK